MVLNVRRPEGAAAKSLIDELRGWVGEQLSPIAKPDEIRLTDNLPKTRSGKIMRRLLRAIARGEEITQDVSTLENPAIIEQLRGAAPLAAAKTAAAPNKAARKVAKQALKKAPKKSVKRSAHTVKRKMPAKRKAAPKRKTPARHKTLRRAPKARGKK